MRTLLSLALLACTSCAMGAPPGFNSAESWAIPIVQPLDDSTLLVPVKINKKGPFLFALNSDWETSSIDYELATALGLRMTRRSEAMGSRDSLQKQVNAEVSSMSLGTLTVSRPTFIARENGHFRYPGLRVYGNIGRDVLADSLSLTVDRSRGMLYLATANHGSTRGPETQVFKLQKRSMMQWRLLVKAAVDAKAALIFLDLANHRSSIRPAPSTPSTTIQVGESSVNGLTPRSFDDQRVDVEDYDGSLGQDFLANFKFTIDFHRKELWLEPRPDDILATTAERLARWGSQFDDCESPACVRIETIPAQRDSDTGAWSPPKLTITRENATLPAYEVIIQPRSKSGDTFGNAMARVALHPDEPSMVLRLDGRLAEDTTFVVLDVSPFPRPCAEPGHCITWMSMPKSEAATPAVSRAPASR